jgi:hypothetical protein
MSSSNMTESTESTESIVPLIDSPRQLASSWPITHNLYMTPPAPAPYSCVEDARSNLSPPPVETDVRNPNWSRKAHVDRPIQPDLSFLDTDSSNILYSAYICANKYERWDALANFKGHSFMFCEDPVIKELMYKVNESYNGHSGCSLGWTMRQLECIAKYGYTEYRGLFDRNVISQL